MYFERLCKELAELSEVEAIALGGSRAAGSYDEKSDYDLYVYISSMIDNEKRSNILVKYCKYLEIGNRYWELEDDCILNDDIPIDIIYRSLDGFESGIRRTIINEEPNNAYSTCFYDNLKNCRIIYDKEGRLQALKDRYAVSYPEGLRRNIINRGLELLSGKLPSYDQQILKAYKRNDYFSINHRTTAFLETYFDIIFAINRITHPGEKRLIEKTKASCRILPKDYEENIMKLLNRDYKNEEELALLLKDLVDNLQDICN